MTRGGSRLVCSDQCSAAFMCLFLKASSLAKCLSPGLVWFVPTG